MSRYAVRNTETGGLVRYIQADSIAEAMSIMSDQEKMACCCVPE